MSTEAVHQVGGTFPAGATVAAYPRVSDFFPGALGKPAATTKVTKATEAKFKDLVDNGPYWLVGVVDGETKALAFTAHDEEVQALSGDEAGLQDSARRIAEKASAGAAAVRVGDPARALDLAETPDELHNPNVPAAPVVGARSSTNAKPRRTSKRGAETAKAQSPKKSPANARVQRAAKRPAAKK